MTPPNKIKQNKAVNITMVNYTSILGKNMLLKIVILTWFLFLYS